MVGVEDARFRRHRRRLYLPRLLVVFSMAIASVVRANQLSLTLEMQSSEHRLHSTNCMDRRGQNVTWVQAAGGGYNYEGLNASHYPDIARIGTGKGDPWLGSLQHCEGGGCSSTKWEPRDSNGDEDCQITRLTPEGLCEVMKHLQFERMYFVGDSLGNQMVQSMHNLLGYHDPPGLKRERGVYTHTFHCPEQSFAYNVSFTRNDKLGNHRSRSTTCGDICHPWLEGYEASSAPTLLILNTGAHIFTPKQFQNVLEGVIKSVQRFARHRDRIVFRTSTPGHVHCHMYQSPFADLDEYHASALRHTAYNWKYMEVFNTYAKQRISNLTNNDAAGGPSWTILDVFPMTVLRPDGKRAPNRKPNGDCLHYKNPGPIDWWNHLLYSQLLDLSNNLL